MLFLLFLFCVLFFASLAYVSWLGSATCLGYPGSRSGNLGQVSSVGRLVSVGELHRLVCGSGMRWLGAVGRLGRLVAVDSWNRLGRLGALRGSGKLSKISRFS